jgi:hypothetical protein
MDSPFWANKTEIHPEGAIFARGACDDKGQMYKTGIHGKTIIFLAT